MIFPLQYAHAARHKIYGLLKNLMLLIIKNLTVSKMTLREELKPREEPTMSRIDHKLHDDIERQMADFMNRGGRVNVIPSGVGIDNLAKLEVRNEFDNTKPGEYAERRKKAQNGANAQAAKRELTPLTVFSQ